MNDDLYALQRLIPLRVRGQLASDDDFGAAGTGECDTRRAARAIEPVSNQSSQDRSADESGGSGDQDAWTCAVQALYQTVRLT